MTSNPTTCCSSPAWPTRAASAARPSGWASRSRPCRAASRRSRRSSASACCCARPASSTVTDFGRSVLEHAHHVVEEVEAAAALAQHRQARAQRAPARVDAGRPRQPRARRRCSPTSSPRYPAIALEVDLSPRRVDLIGGELRRRDPHGRPARRRLARRAPPGGVHGGLYAAPAYLARRGVPPEPEALMEHDALRLLARDGEPMPWVLHARRRSAGKACRPAARPPIRPELLMRLARRRRRHRRS